jgi:molybdopterin-binding protein
VGTWRDEKRKKEFPMRHGARNDIPAKVIRIQREGLMSQVDVELEGTSYHMSSVMTNDSLDSMDIKVGDRVRVLAKAVNILLTKD